jgi:hypothetical protein
VATKKKTWPPKVGSKFRDLEGDLCHVRGIVDGQVVYRFWARHKSRWAYRVEGRYFYEMCLKEKRKPWRHKLDLV